MTLPARAREREAAAAVRELRPWIERRLADVDAARAAIARAPGTVPYLGRALTLREEPRRTRAHRRGDVLLVPAGPARRAALERWYRRTARAEAIAAARRARRRRWARAATRLSIRSQRTRWGSCSPTGAIALNWRLLLGPEEVLDYVVWHEACHLVVMDHSPRFWGLLEQPPARATASRATGCAATAPRCSCERAAAARRRRRPRRVDHFAVVERLPRAGRDRRTRARPSSTRPAAARSPPCRWRGSPARRCC